MLNKSDPLVNKVELLEANPNFARIRYANGREFTVSIGDLAPCPRNVIDIPDH